MTNSLNTSAELLSKTKQSAFRNIATPRDVDAVERVVCSTGVFSAAEVAIARDLIKEHLAKGADESGYYFLFADGAVGLDGYVCFGPIPATDARFELYWIAVDSEAGRKGLGTRLLAAAEDAALQMGAKYLIAETSTTPFYSAARSFYRAVGFSHLGDIANWHSDTDGLAVFGKRL
jgi:GNAT superfamily N-acetyltransferase